MTLEQIINKKINRLDEVPKEYVNEMGKTQRFLYQNILDSLEKLVRDSDGLIKKTQRNLAIIEEIIEDLQVVFSKSDYLKITREFIKEFDVQVEITDEFFMKSFDNFEDSSFSKKALEIAKRNAYNLMAGTPTITKNLYEPVRELLTNAVVTGDSYTKTVRAIRQSIQGGTLNNKVVEGKLVKYAKQMAYDTFAVADRNYTHQISEDLGIEWYRYSGGLVEDSRQFCISRNGKYFHKKEVEAWGKLKAWDGKIPSTDSVTIFSYAGGYRCNHSVLPTSEAVVPQEVIERNIKNGNITRD